MKEELTQTIKELKEVLDENKIYVTNETFLDAIIRLYNTNQINKQKQFYPKPYQRNEFRNDFTPSGTSNKPRVFERQSASPLTSKDELPTEKQIYAIKKSGREIPAGLTRKEASEIIKKIKG